MNQKLNACHPERLVDFSVTSLKSAESKDPEDALSVKVASRRSHKTIGCGDANEAAIKRTP